MIILYKGGDLAKFSYGSVYCLCFMCPLGQRPMDVVDLNKLWTGISWVSLSSGGGCCESVEAIFPPIFIYLGDGSNGSFL